MLHFHDPEPFRSAGRPYAAAAQAGNTVYLAGQLPVVIENGERRVVAPGDMAAQARQVFENLRAVLRGLGGDLGDVAWIHVLVTDIGERLKMDPVRREYFGEPGPPATLAEVRALVLPEAMIEVTGIAVIGDGSR